MADRCERFNQKHLASPPSPPPSHHHRPSFFMLCVYFLRRCSNLKPVESIHRPRPIHHRYDDQLGEDERVFYGVVCIQFVLFEWVGIRCAAVAALRTAGNQCVRKCVKNTNESLRCRKVSAINLGFV